MKSNEPVRLMKAQWSAAVDVMMTGGDGGISGKVETEIGASRLAMASNRA